jgi:prepilin-type N-terminal cleavage/methylation domain-containing protein
MKRIAKGNRGITLVELLIAAAILAVVVSAAFTILLTSMKTYNMNFDSTVSQQNLRTAMMKITKEARNPANTVAITGTKVLTVNGKDYTASSGDLLYNGQAVAHNIASIRADYTDAGHSVIQVDLTATDGNTLSTQISLK